MEKNVNDSGPSSSGESRSSKRKRTDVDQEDSQLFHKDLHKVRIEEHEKKYGHLDEIDIFPVDHFPTVTQAYEHLRLKCALLPISKNTFPVVWRHQLYALFSNRSQVDEELETMNSSNQVRIIHLTNSARLSTDIIVSVSDYCDFFEKEKNLFINLFLNRVVRAKAQSVFTLHELGQVGFGAPAVSKAAQMGMLTIDDLNLSLRKLSFPGLGVYVRALYAGRKALLTTIQKCKNGHCMQSELIKGKLLRNKGALLGPSSLGLELHMYDLYGCGMVTKDIVGQDVLVRCLPKK